MTERQLGSGSVLVTGGSRGIGAAIVTGCVRAGMSVAFTFAREAAAADRLLGRLSGDGPPGPRVRAVRADVTDEAAMRTAFDLAESLGPLSAVVNNAGITGRIAPFVHGTTAETRHVLDVNLLAPIMVSRMAIRRWLDGATTAGAEAAETAVVLGARGSASGRCIVNVSSVAARLGAPGEYIPYAAAKAGLETLTVGLAKEVADFGIRVNAVAAGTTRTGIHAAAGEPNRPDRVATSIPLGRPAEPEEIAAAVLWLLSPEAAYVTGAVLPVTGGV